MLNSYTRLFYIFTLLYVVSTQNVPVFRNGNNFRGNNLPNLNYRDRIVFRDSESKKEAENKIFSPQNSGVPRERVKTIELMTVNGEAKVDFEVPNEGVVIVKQSEDSKYPNKNSISQESVLIVGQIPNRERGRGNSGPFNRPHNAEFYQGNNFISNNKRDHRNRDESDEESSESQSEEQVRRRGIDRSKGRERGRNEQRGSSGGRRLCEVKYAEYISRIFPNDADTRSDATESNFDGRELAEPGQYPHMTALGFADSHNGVDYKCGGSLISELFVITAAHCANFTGEVPTKVRIGDINLKVQESYVEPQIRGIRRIFIHPAYNSNSYYSDIALLQLDESIIFTEFVRPIRLWTHSHIPFKVAYAMGYGATSFARAQTNLLTHFNMTIVPNDECNQQMPVMPEISKGIVDSQICARDFEKNRDTCQGDSGGPLQLNIRGRRRRNRKHYHLIGITSFGLFCRSSYPSVYTRVSSFLDWIESLVWSV